MALRCGSLRAHALPSRSRQARTRASPRRFRRSSRSISGWQSSRPRKRSRRFFRPSPRARAFVRSYTRSWVHENWRRLRSMDVLSYTWRAICLPLPLQRLPLLRKASRLKLPPKVMETSRSKARTESRSSSPSRARWARLYEELQSPSGRGCGWRSRTASVQEAVRRSEQAEFHQAVG